MKKGKLGKFFSVLLALIVTVLVTFTVTNINQIKEKDQETSYLVPVETNKQILNKEEVTNQTVEPTVEPTIQPTINPEELEESSVTLLAVGDNLIHTQVIKSGRQSNGSYNFEHLYKNLKKDIKKADIAIINQETVLGGKELGYSGYPRFNSPTEIGDAVVKAGFDVVLHATNHSMDKGEKGLQNSLDFWKKHKEITVLGANETEEEYEEIPIVEKNGIKIAMLNYTYGLNGLPLPKDRKYMVNLLEEDKVRSDIKKAKEQADFVIVFPHWGTEYRYTPSSEQEKWTSIFSEEGVDLVIGAHPHVLENVEWITNATGHKMLVYYSLGNCVSGQTEVPRALGGLANITITKKGGKTSISEASITPTVTHFTSSYGGYSVYKLSDYTDSLANKHRLHRKGLTVTKLKSLSKQILGEWYK